MDREGLEPTNVSNVTDLQPAAFNHSTHLPKKVLWEPPTCANVGTTNSSEVFAITHNACYARARLVSIPTNKQRVS